MIRTWTLGILCILVTSFFVGYTITVQKNDTLVDARTHMVNSVHYLNLDIERTFYGLEQTFTGIQNYLLAVNRLQTTPDDDIQTVLNKLVSENPFVTSYLILNPDGKIEFSGHLGERSDLRHTDYFSIHKNHKFDQLYVGRPFVSKDNKNNWTFAVSKGQRDGNGTLTSVMVAMIDISYLKARYLNFSLQAGASMTISSVDDYIYLQLPKHEDYVGKHVPGITQKIADTTKTLVVRHNSSDAEQTYFSASRKIGSSPLVVSVKESQKTILSKWQKSARNFLGLGVVISLIMLFMTYQVSRYQHKQQQIKEELRNQASTDALTGLANRRFVLEQAAHEIKKAKRSGSALSFIMMDLDHFKEVNDSYGHEIGDMVLKDTSIILKKLCRESDIVSRYGGEEFLLVLPDTDLKGALIDAERIRKSLEKTSHWCKNKQFVVTASFGVSQWAENEQDCDVALRRADDALYKVKYKGRNSIMSLPNTKVTLLRKDFKRNLHGA